LSSPRKLEVAPHPAVAPHPYRNPSAEKAGAADGQNAASPGDLAPVYLNQQRKHSTLTPKDTMSDGDGQYPYNNIIYGTRNSHSQSTNGEMSTSLNTYVRIKE